MQVLKEHFENKAKIQPAYLQKLMTILDVSSHGIKGLQTFMDTVKVYAHGLLQLADGKVDIVDMQCITIVPCLFEKLP